MHENIMNTATFMPCAQKRRARFDILGRFFHSICHRKDTARSALTGASAYDAARISPLETKLLLVEQHTVTAKEANLRIFQELFRARQRVMDKGKRSDDQPT